MFQRIKQTKQDESGFSLIELLVVIIILGILAGIVVFAVGGINDRGQLAACKADKKTITVAQEAYYATNKSVTNPPNYAPNVGALVGAQLLSETSTMHTTAWDGPGTPATGSKFKVDKAGDCLGLTY